MRVWLLNASEQLAHGGAGRRRMRTGLLAHALLERGHDVWWWKSTFEHVSKTHYRQGHGIERVEPGLTIGWIHSRGYRSHVSLARFLDHREIGVRFGRLAAGQPRPDVLVCSLPIPELAVAGVAYAKGRGIPVVVDIRDWWPDALVFSLPRLLRGAARLLLKPYEGGVRRACESATAITGITPVFVDWGLARARRDRGPLDHDFPHGYEAPCVSEEEASAAREYWDSLNVKASPGFNVSFIGSVTRTFNFSPILAAAKSCFISGTPVCFVICGSGDRLPEVMKLASGLPNVVFTGKWVGAAEIQELLHRTSVGLVPLPDRPDFLATINNKTVEYLSAGVPIITSPERSSVSALAATERCGVSWDGESTPALLSAIDAYLQDRRSLQQASVRARAYYERHFNASRVYSEFSEYLETIAGPRACVAVRSPVH